MATRDSIDNMISEANGKLETARKELDEVNRNGFNVDSEYIESQLGLEQVEQDIQKLMHSSNHQQGDQLHRLHLQVSQCLNDMILDHVDVENEE